MEYSIVLASRLLMEEYPLWWFGQSTFGERHRSSSRSDAYLVSTEYMYTPAAMAKVKVNLKELGEVITLMHALRSFESPAWGTTYRTRSIMPFVGELHSEDFHHLQDKYQSSQYQHHQPCIVMNGVFQDYFRHGWKKGSGTTDYRVMFVFAVTLVHKVAHAYHLWLNGWVNEPLWAKGEIIAGLGFSWERAVLGRVVNPLCDRKGGGFQTFFSTQLKVHETPQQRNDALWTLFGTNNSRLTYLDSHGKIPRDWPLLEPSDSRGSELFLDRPCRNWTAAIYAVLMAWIVSWFQEVEWVRRKKGWRLHNRYNPPPLVDAFVLMYEREPD